MLVDHFTQGFFDQWRTRREYRAVRGHHGPISNGHRHRAVPCRGTEHRSDERNVARQMRLDDEVGWCAHMRFARHPGAMAGTVEYQDVWATLLQRDLADAVALGGGTATDRPAQYREVFAPDHHRKIGRASCRERVKIASGET